MDINLVMGTGQGLLTPVLRDVSSRGLKSISLEIGGFEDSLFTEGGTEMEASKMAIGTFSIHNLGKAKPPSNLLVYEVFWFPLCCTTLHHTKL